MEGTQVTEMVIFIRRAPSEGLLPAARHRHAPPPPPPPPLPLAAAAATG